MQNPNSAFRLIYMLTTCTTGPCVLNLKIFRFEFNINLETECEASAQEVKTLQCSTMWQHTMQNMHNDKECVCLTVLNKSNSILVSVSWWGIQIKSKAMDSPLQLLGRLQQRPYWYGFDLRLQSWDYAA